MFCSTDSAILCMGSSLKLNILNCFLRVKAVFIRHIHALCWDVVSVAYLLISLDPCYPTAIMVMKKASIFS